MAVQTGKVAGGKSAVKAGGCFRVAGGRRVLGVEVGFRRFSLVLLDSFDMLADSFRAGGDRMRPESLRRQRT